MNCREGACVQSLGFSQPQVVQDLEGSVLRPLMLPLSLPLTLSPALYATEYLWLPVPNSL